MSKHNAPPADVATPALDSQLFRRALGQFGTGVTVVTTTHKGARYGVTSNSFASVSLEPPLVLWSIKKTSQSYDAFTRAERFAINILSVEQSAISGVFAKSGGDKFAGLDWRPDRGGAPLLAGTAAAFSCRTWATFDGGDHTIIVGEVDDFLHADRDILLFAQGRYARAEQFVDAARGPVATAGAGAAEEAPFLAVTLRNAYGVLRNEMEGFRRDVGISHIQAAILFALRDHPGMTSERLTPQYGFVLPFDDAELQELVAAGHVARSQHDELHLTVAGQRVLDAFLEKTREMERAVSTGFSAREMEIVWRFLGQVASRPTTTGR